MAGSAYVKREDGTQLSLENVANISVATPFVIFVYEDGAAVLERTDLFESIQFTPYKEADEETAGEVTDN